MRKGDSIYLDHQASCPIDGRVLDAVRKAFSDGIGNPHSSEHSFGWRAADAVGRAQEQVASLLGADRDEIVFTSGATEANNLALLGRRYSDRKKVIITPIEHKCVLECARHLKEQEGVEICEVEIDSEGAIDLDHLSVLADGNTALIAIIGVHNEIGTIQPIEAISAVARNVGAHVHFDMAQAPAAIDMRGVAALADTASLSGHKMYGPQGIGCLYINRSEQHAVSPIMRGGGQQGGLRSGTIPAPLAIGMGEASELIANAGGDRVALRRLNQLLWAKLCELPCNIELNGPCVEQRHPGNLNVSFKGYDGRDIIGAIQPKLAVSSGSACTSGIEEPSYVIRALGLSEERARSAIRLSIGRSTTETDILDAVNILREALERAPLFA